MKVIHGSRSEDYETDEYKTCPVCHALCFADMDVCFGCLHHFENERSSKTELQEAIDAIIEQDIDEPPAAPSKQPARLDSRDPAPIAVQRPTPASNAGAHDRPAAKEPLDATPLQHDACAMATCEDAEGSTLHHICQSEDGRRFEISITVKML